MDMAVVTHFSSALPLDVDLRPRTPAPAEEQPVDVMPYYYADYVNFALSVSYILSLHCFIILILLQLFVA